MKDQLFNACAEMFDVHPRDLRGRYRFDFLMKPRFALYKALDLRGINRCEIGRIVERDHSTVRHGILRAEYFMVREPDFAERVRALADGVVVPTKWLSTPHDVMNYVCDLAGEQPAFVSRTQEVNRNSYVLCCLVAKVCTDACMPINTLGKVIRHGAPVSRRMAAEFPALLTSSPKIEDIYLRAVTKFPQKGVAIDDCMVQ